MAQLAAAYTTRCPSSLCK